MGIVYDFLKWNYRRLEYIPKLLYYLFLIFLILLAVRITMFMLRWTIGGFLQYHRDARNCRSLRKQQNKVKQYGDAFSTGSQR